MSGSTETLRALVDALNRGDPKVTKEFNEWSAIDSVREMSDVGSLPWATLRRGSADAWEPDWVVIDKAGRIAAGFEVTELSFALVRKANAKLDALKRRGGSLAGKGKRKQESGCIAEHAYAIVAGNTDLVPLQRTLAKIDAKELAAEIVARIHAKKRRPYHGQSAYPVHLIIHEPRWLYLLASGTRKDAIREAGIHAESNFAAIWHVDDRRCVSRIDCDAKVRGE